MRNLKCYKRMLLSIDTVKGFILKGALHDETIAKIIPYQVALLEEAVEDQECLVVLIGEGHTLQSIEFKRFNDEPHGLLGDEESEFVDEFQPFWIEIMFLFSERILLVLCLLLDLFLCLMLV